MARKAQSLFRVVIDPQDLQRMREALSPSQYRSATFQAVKGTTGKVRTIIAGKVRERSEVKKKYVDRVIRTKQPRGDPPVGEVTVSQELLPLIAFKARALKRGGVRVTVSPDRTPLTLRHAFLAKMKSGHTGVFLRARHLPTKGPNAGLKTAKGKPKYKLTARGIAGRFAIDEQFGPSVLQVVALPEVLDSIVLDVGEDLAKRVNSQMDRFLKPKGGAAGGGGSAPNP
jgi:hypothetical protein